MLNLKVLLILLLTASTLFSQHEQNNLKVSGTILSYTYDDTKSIFKKEKQIEIEGSLASAELKVKNSAGKIILKTLSDHGGNFNFSVPLGGRYTVIYSKEGYGTSAFELDVRHMSNEFLDWGLVLINLDLILNNYESDKAQDNGEPFGRVTFNASAEKFKFEAFEFDHKKRLFKQEEDNTSVNLMRNSIEKNEPFNRLDMREIKVEDSSLSGNGKRLNTNNSGDTLQSGLTIVGNQNKTYEIFQNYKDLNFLEEGFSEADILRFENEINATKAALEIERQNAVTEADFIRIAAKERLLASAELQLTNARVFIQKQSETIAAQQSFIWALAGVLLLLIALIVFVIIAYRSKRRNLAALAERNHKITESLNYATRIQRSVLLSDVQIKSLLPKSFVFYRPLDAVSGDFYWFTKIDSTIIMAAVDCTGHGVPGAFMSLIGNTLMNQIVNEKHILTPKDILAELNEGIVRSLNQNNEDESVQDGMDVAVCAFDEKTRKLTFSGANNSIYLVQKGEINVLKANILAVGGYVRKNKKISFNQQEIFLNPNDRIYLFSDGYMDQFGGQKDEKFNISRFKELLKSMRDVKMSQQLEKVEKTLEDWQGQGNQTDDILLIGVEV